MKLYLIRHGKTQANEQHLYCGSTDIGLSAKGIEELEKKHYILPDDCRFITSGMKRTVQTLEILFGKRDYTADERFREIDFGVFEMKSYEQLKDCREYKEWISGDNENNIPPHGESGNMVRERVIPAVKEILESSSDTAIISHGGVIAIIMEYLFPDEGKNRYQWQPKQGCGYVVENGKYSIIE